MLELDEEPLAGGVEAGVSDEREQPPFTRSVLLTLVPNSSIQFVDFEMAEEAVARIRRRFFEERTEDGEPSLHVAATTDGVFHHPITGEPCDPRRTYTTGGVDALAPFLDAWLPLPYMRVSEREEDGALVLDEGPSNWTRVHVSRHRVEDGAWHYRVVLGIDTAIDADPKQPQRGYVGPSLEDLKARSAYRFSDDVNDIAWFVSEAWVDDWLKALFERGASEDDDAPGANGLGHLAAYLTVLAVMKEACELPALRFMEPNAIGAFAETVPVDLALDIGTGRLAALIEERHVSGAREAAAATPAPAIRHLGLRDLSLPWKVETASCSSRLTFSRAMFGSEALSRWSGRMNAFQWPLPARVGGEADRLAGLPTASEAATGVSSPMHYVWDERPARHVWRFAGLSSDAGDRRNAVVSGAILAHLTEAGDLIEGRGG